MDMKSNAAYDTHFNTGPQTRMTGDETGGDYEVMDEGDRVIYEVINGGPFTGEERFSIFNV